MKKFRNFLIFLLIAVIIAAIVLYATGKLSNIPSALGFGSKQNRLSDKTALTELVAKNQADIYDNLDFAVKKNHDAVAWLQVPETDINNVVMQGDDNDYYLRRNEDKKDDIYGCYFADYECSMGEYDDFLENTIIYGHSDSKDNPNGKRFAQLHRFVNEDFAKKVPYIYLSTPYGKFKFEIFSVFYTDTEFDYIKVNISQEEKLELAKKAKSLSIHKYSANADIEDKLLTLSTCTVKYGNDPNKRFVVMAKLCPLEQE